MRGTKIAALVGGGTLGGLFSLAVAATAGSLGVVPNFPAYRGEDDFALRFAFFGLAVVPGFILLGAWIAAGALNGRRPWKRSIAGVVAGSVVTCLIARMLASQIAAASTAQTANAAAVGFLLLWPALALSGIYLATFRTSAAEADNF